MKIIRILISWITSPLVILIIWCVSATVLLMFSNYGFSAVERSHADPALKPLLGKRISAGDMVSFGITSENDYLGIVTIDFFKLGEVKNLSRNDVLEVRIREKGAKEWYNIHRYPVGYFTSDQPLSVGFPPIRHSAEKDYELTMRLDTPKDSIELYLGDDTPLVKSIYIYDKKAILSSPATLLSFLATKFVNAVHNYSLSFIFITFGLPVLIYAAITFITSPYGNRKAAEYVHYARRVVTDTLRIKSTGSQVIFLLIFISTIILDMPVAMYVFVLTLWIGFLKINTLGSNSSFMAALVLLFFIPLLAVLERDVQADKIATWVYLFLIIATIHRMYELHVMPRREAQSSKRKEQK